MERLKLTSQVTSSLVTAIRQFRGLMSLPSSQLCRDILRPVNERVFLSLSPDMTANRSRQVLYAFKLYFIIMCTHASRYYAFKNVKIRIIGVYISERKNGTKRKKTRESMPQVGARVDAALNIKQAKHTN